MAEGIIPAELWAELRDRSPWHSVRCFTAADEERCRRAEDAHDAAAAAAATSMQSPAIPPSSSSTINAPSTPLGTQTAVWGIKFAASVLHGAALVVSDLSTRHYAAFLVPASLLTHIRAGRDVEMTLQQALRMADTAIRSGSTTHAATHVNVPGPRGDGTAQTASGGGGGSSNARRGGDGSSLHLIDPSGSGAAFGYGPHCTLLLRLRTHLRLRGVASHVAPSSIGGAAGGGGSAGGGDVFLPLEMRIPCVPVAAGIHDPLERALAEAAFVRDVILRPALTRLVAAEALCDVAVMDALRCRGLFSPQSAAAAGVVASLAEQALPRVDRFVGRPGTADLPRPQSDAQPQAAQRQQPPALATLLQVGLGDVAAGAQMAPPGRGDPAAVADMTSEGFVGFRAALAALDAARVDAERGRLLRPLEGAAASDGGTTAGGDAIGRAGASSGGLDGGSEPRGLRRSASSYVETPEEKQRRLAMRRERDEAVAAAAGPPPHAPPPAIAATPAVGTPGAAGAPDLATAVAQQQRAAAAVQKKLQRVFR